MSKFGVFFDSDAFVGIRLPDDAHSERANGIYTRIKQQETTVVTSSWVVAETATVLSHHAGQAQARAFLSMIAQTKFPVIHVTEELQREATRVFMEQTVKGTSMTDCGNAAILRRFTIPVIFSFDEVYAKRFGLKTAA